jgi:hypothetical protein
MICEKNKRNVASPCPLTQTTRSVVNHRNSGRGS